MLTSPRVRLLIFALLMLALGGVSSVVGVVVAGWPGLEAGVWATGLCLLPGLVVLGFEPWFESPRGQVAVMVVGTLVRVGVAAGGAVMLVQWRPDLPRAVFLVSLLVLYMVSLAGETVLITRRTTASSGSRTT